MNWRHFLKPNKQKIVVTIILFTISVCISFLGAFACFDASLLLGGCNLPIVISFPLILLTLPDYLLSKIFLNSYLNTFSNYSIFIILAYQYLISSVYVKLKRR
jgi:hypothetical protein